MYDEDTDALREARAEALADPDCADVNEAVATGDRVPLKYAGCVPIGDDDADTLRPPDAENVRVGSTESEARDAVPDGVVSRDAEVDTEPDCDTDALATTTVRVGVEIPVKLDVDDTQAVAVQLACIVRETE